jgi:hypothetical protein
VFRLTFLLFASLLVPLHGKDIAVLIDVSGTMGHYGSWQLDARQLTSSILAGEPKTEGWISEGSESTTVDFHLESGDRIHLLRFGSIRNPEFPFFSPAHTLNALNAFQAEFPDDLKWYNEPRTNKPLAVAVGARLTSGVEGIARLIVISDFLVDSEMSATQQRVVNQFESRAKIESPLIYTWNRNPRVQIKLLRISALPSSAQTPDLIVERHLRITGAKLLDSPRRVLLTWVLLGEDTEASYSVTIRDPKSGRTILTRSVITNSLLWSNPASGKYVWQVTADLPDKHTLSSSVTPLDIPGDSPLGLITIFLLIVASAVGLRLYTKHRSPAPEKQHEEKATWKA